MSNLIASIIRKSQEREIVINNSPTMGALEKVKQGREEAKTQLTAINAYISAYAVESKNKRSGSVGLIRALKTIAAIDETTALSGLGNPGEDKVMCPMLDKLIARDECETTSGSDKECIGCEIGIETKRLLLPAKE